MNNITKEKKLNGIAIGMTILFGILFLFSLLGMLLLIKSTPDNGMLFACALCCTPAIGIYYAFSSNTTFSKKQRAICSLSSIIAFAIFDIIYFILLNKVSNNLDNSFTIGGLNPKLTYILAVFIGEISLFYIFLKFCQAKKKALDILCMPISVILPFLCVPLAVIFIIVIGCLFIYKIFKFVYKLYKSGNFEITNWYDKTFTINENGRTFRLTHHGRDLTNNAEEFVDEYNQHWITQDKGRTFYRK